MIKRVHPKTIEERIRQILCLDGDVEQKVVPAAISSSPLSAADSESLAANRHQQQLGRAPLKVVKVLTMNSQPKYLPYNLQRSGGNSQQRAAARAAASQQQQQQRINIQNRPPPQQQQHQQFMRGSATLP